MSESNNGGEGTAPQEGSDDKTSKNDGAEAKQQEGHEGGQENKKQEGGEYDAAEAAQKEHWKKKALEAQAALDEKNQAEKEAEEKRMKENEEWKTLAEKRESEAKEAKERYKQATLKNAFIVKIAGHNPVDIDDAFALADLSEVKVSDDGTVEGLDGAIGSLVESKPHLFGGSGSKNVNADAGTQNKDGDEKKSTRVWKSSEVEAMSLDEYEKHKDDIALAQREGRYIKE